MSSFSIRIAACALAAGGCSSTTGALPSQADQDRAVLTQLDRLVSTVLKFTPRDRTDAGPIASGPCNIGSDGDSVWSAEVSATRTNVFFYQCEFDGQWAGMPTALEFWGTVNTPPVDGTCESTDFRVMGTIGGMPITGYDAICTVCGLFGDERATSICGRTP
jgi:hypothetical protein